MGAKSKIEYAKNIAELCRLLKIDRNTYYVWRTMDNVPAKASDNRLNVTAWRQFIDDNGLKSKSTKDNLTIGDLQREKLSKQNALLQIDIEKKRGDLLPRDQVQTDVTRVIAQFKSVLYTKLESEAPPVLEGMAAADIQLYLRGALGEAFEQLSEGKWN